MNLKILKYTALVVFALLWLPGFSPNVARWLAQKGFVKDEYRYGDLYRFSNLAQFRVPNQQCVPAPVKVTSPNTALYLIGDSFTEPARMTAADFKTGTFQRFFIGDTSFIKLDRTKKNILIIETVERHFRERFAQPYANLVTGKPSTRQAARKMLLNARDVFWYSTERHEAVLFSSDFFLKIKEWKAGLNETFFNRSDSHVVLSADKKRIFFEMDARPDGITSSFDRVSDSEISRLVENVNRTYDFYKKNGFDEVYLSIAPNKSSVLGKDLGNYNRLIERVQQHPGLKAPYFDIYTPFSSSKKMLYDVGDTHWNCEGKQIWLDAVNEKL
ncbi:hypothetical protein [Emticicia sp. 21SJ11W-3]|uniref:hypothetical protein n=1 Tax=Emticicia sp. 21SJ11W-3 TaxID=2916755 RepID=UPI00209E0E0A|nr:hypothetical protein [Emticicia sp. 21SJ11W-3]UTA66408.1 hypothetical protein MB380_12445 [Emticicia sp. 21SJ11W-3]